MDSERRVDKQGSHIAELALRMRRRFGIVAAARCLSLHGTGVGLTVRLLAGLARREGREALSAGLPQGACWQPMPRRRDGLTAVVCYRAARLIATEGLGCAERLLRAHHVGAMTMIRVLSCQRLRRPG